jgi:hypothetical protein
MTRIQRMCADGMMNRRDAEGAEIYRHEDAETRGLSPRGFGEAF